MSLGGGRSGRGGGSSAASASAGSSAKAKAQQHRLVIKHKLNERNVYELDLPVSEFGRLLGLVRDPASNTVWLFSTKAVRQIVIQEEDRDVWLLYLNKAKAGDVREFDTALRFCKNRYVVKKKRRMTQKYYVTMTGLFAHFVDSIIIHSFYRKQRDAVATAQADYFFKQRNYDLAAQHYARTLRPFESIALKFVEARQPNSVATFLLHRLDQLRAEDATARSMLCVWLVELFLQSLNEIEERDVSAAATASPTTMTALAMHETEDCRSKRSEEFRQRLTEFLRFLRDHAQDLYTPGDHGRTTIALLEEHGRTDALLLFAQAIGRHELVIEHHIQRAGYASAAKAIATLLRAGSSGSGAAVGVGISGPSGGAEGGGGGKGVDFDVEILYRYSPLLVRKVPTLTVAVWESAVQCGVQLDVSRLVPSVAELMTGVLHDSQDGSLAARRQSLQSQTGELVPNSELATFLRSSDGLIIRFLEVTCWRNAGDVSEAVHNLLVTLKCVRSCADSVKLAAQGLDGDDVLMAYLQEQGSTPCYDVSYALRICKSNGYVCVLWATNLS